MMNDLLPQVDARSFFLLIASIVVLIISLLTIYGVIPNFKSFQLLSSDLIKLERVVASNNNVQENIANLSTEIDEVKHQLRGDMANLPEKEMEAYIIGVLQNISWNNNVNLIAVKPSKGSEIREFQEMLFKVKLSGEYHDLYQWFKQLRIELGFIVIKNLNLNPLSKGNNETPILMDLSIASYKNIT
ncbi:MAG: type 4a pilus biogenesis protein PilO [Gammaproteobacteria bacterium]